MHTPTSSFADAHPSFSKLVTEQVSSIRYLQCGPLHVLGGGDGFGVPDILCNCIK